MATATDTMTTSVNGIPGYVAGTWDIDPVHSRIGCEARHMFVSKVRGCAGSCGRRPCESCSVRTRHGCIRSVC